MDPFLDEAICLICLCSDNAACEGGCSWLAVDRDRRIGICSECGVDQASAQEILDALVVAEEVSE